jgi:hypothetical protein
VVAIIIFIFNSILCVFIVVYYVSTHASPSPLTLSGRVLIPTHSASATCQIGGMLRDCEPYRLAINRTLSRRWSDIKSHDGSVDMPRSTVLSVSLSVYKDIDPTSADVCEGIPMTVWDDMSAFGNRLLNTVMHNGYSWVPPHTGNEVCFNRDLMGQEPVESWTLAISCYVPAPSLTDSATNTTSETQGLCGLSTNGLIPRISYGELEQGEVYAVVSNDGALVIEYVPSATSTNAGFNKVPKSIVLWRSTTSCRSAGVSMQPSNELLSLIGNDALKNVVSYVSSEIDRFMYKPRLLLNSSTGVPYILCGDGTSNSIH